MYKTAKILKNLLGLSLLWCLLTGAALAYESDYYRITHPNTLITANQSDLETFMFLNSQGRKREVRALYNLLEARGLLFNVQPGTYVHVTAYYEDGTARIEWDGGNYGGFINTDDLSRYLGSD